MVVRGGAKPKPWGLCVQKGSKGKKKEKDKERSSIRAKVRRKKKRPTKMSNRERENADKKKIN